MARGRKAVRAPFILQMAPKPEDLPGTAGGDGCWRIGFTASRKVGGAVQRNRAKRRLRAISREVMAEAARDGFDYVLVARTPVLTCAYDRLRADLLAALSELERGGRRSGQPSG